LKAKQCQCCKTFFSVTDAPDKNSKEFGPGEPFQPILIFVGRMKHHEVLHSGMLHHWTWLKGAYPDQSVSDKEKSFKFLTIGQAILAQKVYRDSFSQISYLVEYFLFMNYVLLKHA
jgi:hypothetical protein